MGAQGEIKKKKINARGRRSGAQACEAAKEKGRRSKTEKNEVSKGVEASHENRGRKENLQIKREKDGRKSRALIH